MSDTIRTIETNERTGQQRESAHAALGPPALVEHAREFVPACASCGEKDKRLKRTNEERVDAWHVGDIYKARALAAEALQQSQAQEIEKALTLAKEATNGWACYAKRNIEHDEITRLHREIDSMRAALKGQQP